MSFLDRVMLFLIATLAALPFTQVLFIQVSIASLGAYEALYLLISFVICLKVVLTGRLRYPASFCAFFTVSFLYVVYSSIQYGVGVADSLRQLRFFAPFIVATLILSTDFQVPFNTYFKWIIGATFLSSASALYIHYLAPGFLEIALAGSEDLYLIANYYGRLYWTNLGITLFPLLGVFIARGKLYLSFLVFVSLTSLGAVVATSNRTTLAGCLLFLAAALFLSGSFTSTLRRLRLTFAIVCAAFAVGVALVEADSRIANMVDLRIFGRGDLYSVYEQAVIEGRSDLYRLYASSIKAHFPMGQGLGRPHSTRLDETEVFTTDISILSFVLPFGVFGLLILTHFWWRLFSIIKGCCLAASDKRLLLILLGTFLIMSLNIDYFSRNNCVIFLTALVMTLNRRTHPSGATPIATAK